MNKSLEELEKELQRELVMNMYIPSYIFDYPPAERTQNRINALRQEIIEVKKKEQS